MKKSLRFLTAAALAAAIGGCSIFVPHTQQITIQGQPSDAQIVINGNSVPTGTTYRVRRDRMLSIAVSKPGWTSYTGGSDYSLSAWGVLDIIGGVIWLVPFFGLCAPGSRSLHTDEFHYELVQKTPPQAQDQK